MKNGSKRRKISSVANDNELVNLGFLFLGLTFRVIFGRNIPN
jgi:hypothetical protein